MDALAFGRRERARGFVDVLLAAAGERGNHGTAHLAGDVRHGVGVGRRGDGKARFDDVHAQRVQRPGHLHFRRHFQRKPRRLFAVAQRRVEDGDSRGIVSHV